MPSFFKRIKNFFTGRRNEPKSGQQQQKQGDSKERGEYKMVKNKVNVAEHPPPSTEHIYDEDCQPDLPPSPPSPSEIITSIVPVSIPLLFQTPKAVLPQLNDSISREIYMAVADTWSEFRDVIEGSPRCFRFKVIAAFVAVDTEQSYQPRATALSIGTGSRWLLAENFKLDGGTVHDCHAEIIARRAFICLLYEQLQMICNGSRSSKLIIEPSPQFSENGGRGPPFRLKSTLELYLYISKPPCGSAQFPGWSTANRLRVKKGNCQAFSYSSYVANFNRLAAGLDETLLMSCTDKLTAWSVTGVQGALLSAFLEPVYLSGLVYSEANYELGGVQRALFSRLDVGRLDEKLLESSSSSSDHYHHLYSTFHQLAIGFHSSDSPKLMKDMGGKSFTTSISHNWFRSAKGTGGTVELIDTETGKVSSMANETDGKASRLSKKSLAGQYRQLTLASRFRTSSSAPESSSSIVFEKLVSDRLKGTYLEQKLRSSPYMAAKWALKETLQEQGLGSWSHVPAHVDMFIV